jgi:hypothetical protein
MLEDNPFFIFELHLTNRATTLRVPDPMLLTGQPEQDAWDVMTGFTIDLVDALLPGCTDERFTEIFIELLYRLVYRAMTTLDMPTFEKNVMERIARRKTRRKGDTN